MNCRPCWQSTTSNDVVGQRQVGRVGREPAIAGAAVAGDLEHLRVEVDADDCRAPRRRAAGDDAGAAGDVQDASRPGRTAATRSSAKGVKTGGTR